MKRTVGSAVEETISLIAYAADKSAPIRMRYDHIDKAADPNATERRMIATH